VVVFSAGNNAANTVSYPASLPNVIAVGAIDRCGVRAGRVDVIPNSCDPWMYLAGSAYGTALSVVAPGSNVRALTLHRGFRDNFSGTSAAAPHVSGVAALILSVNPDLYWWQVRDIIESTAQRIRPDLYTYSIIPGRNNGTWNKEMGHGLVNAYAAVRKAAGLCVASFAGEKVVINREVIGCDSLEVREVDIINNSTLTIEAPGGIIITGPIQLEAGSGIILR